MKVEELVHTLKEKGFCEEKRDSGYYYTVESGHIKLICYIEPHIEIEFVSIYRWNDNDVKGTYNISTKHFAAYQDTVAFLFRKTKNNLPQYIGETVDTHQILEKAIQNIFE